MGRKESSSSNKKDAFNKKNKEIVKTKKKDDDDRCRKECKNYRNDKCLYGVITSNTEEGAPCTGKKELRRRRFFGFSKTVE